MIKKLMFLLLVVLVLTFVGNSTANAALYTSATAWDTYVGAHLYVDIPGADGSFQTGFLALPYGGTLDFPSDPKILQVPTSWFTWSGGQTPKVLYTGLGITSLEGLFSSSQSAFGLEIEPNPFGLYLVSLEFADGRILSQKVQGKAGAKFFGWADESVSRMTISSDVEFAVGRMVQGHTAPVPEPSSMMLLGMGVLGLLSFRKKS